MIVAGIDLSLTGTGLAHAYPDRPGGPLVLTHRYEPPGTGLDRLRAIRRHVDLRLGRPEVVVLEAPSYRSTGQYSHEAAGLWWFVRDVLKRDLIRIVEVPPATLKLYATGNGRAPKGQMVAKARLYLPWDGSGTHDEADAAWLAAIGCDLAGQPIARQPDDAKIAAGRHRALTTLRKVTA